MGVDIDNDRLEVRYDPGRVTVPVMLRTVRQQGFTAKVFDESAGASP